MVRNNKTGIWIILLILLSTSVAASQTATQSPAPVLLEKIGFHKAVYDSSGKLLPWTSWAHALELEMQWYLNCPVNEHGYPTFIYTTFMDGEYKPYRFDTIPCTQLGMGILSYLKYWRYTGKADPKILKWARLMGDYLVNETLTPDEGDHPRFTRSTGYGNEFPISRSAQGDEKLGPNVIEPDKGGIAGYALVLLYDATGQKEYLDQAIQNADCLLKNMRQGTAQRSPWPFRVDAITGQYWGERSGNMVYILRLFDVLIERSYQRFTEPRQKLWAWIRDVQIPAPDSKEQSLWIQFFEDMSPDDNRNSWAPLNTARYLIEKKEALDPNWKSLAERCIEFAIKHFGIEKPGEVTLMGEQDSDRRPWGGACSTLGGVAAMFYAAGGGEKYREIAYRNLNWVTYFIDADGGPAALCIEDDFKKGSWQEDCHTDVVHNFMDAIKAVREWRGERYFGKELKSQQPKAIPEDEKDTVILGHHKAVFDTKGRLLPWITWDDALSREMQWYLQCPMEKGYPVFALMTFMDGDYRLLQDKRTFIPATQNGMGIISYLKYYAYTGKKDARVLQLAKLLGDYLVNANLTPDEGKYPRFSRSTGWAFAVPQPPDCGSQADRPFEVQPDKAGIAGYALTLLYQETKDDKYLTQSLQDGRVLVRNMRQGDATQSPWPFRVDYRSGQGRGEVSGNMSFVLRLFDQLITFGYSEFKTPREKLWRWIIDYQIPNLEKDGMLWLQFFEDHEEPDNRTAWSPLNLARYLLEKKDAIDPQWHDHSKKLIDFVNKNYTSVRNGVQVCGEQDHDKNPWGGILSTYGAVLAMYSAATGSTEYNDIARQALNYSLYAISEDGYPADMTRVGGGECGGWQEDAHTDKIHNFMDAIAAFPKWAKSRD